MDENQNYEKNTDRQDDHTSYGGVIFLAVATASILGSLIFSFQSEKTSVPSVQELLKLGTEEEAEIVQKEQSLQKETDLPSGKVKGFLDVSDVVEATMPSIVAITNESVQTVESYFFGSYEMASESAGSGILIGENEEELLIATNYHVIEDAETITICFSVEEELTEDAIVTGKMKGTDSARDLAVVAVEKTEIPETIQSKIKIAKLGDSEDLQVGERAIAIGNALGYGQSVTAGIISAQNRELTIDKTPQKFIQTDAAINFGNSGGALLNKNGEVIGINSAKAASEGVEGMGYAIPINEAKPILEKLISRKTRDRVDVELQGSLGAQLRNVSEEAQQLYGISAGAFVYELGEDSALAKAGVAAGTIITEFDGNRVNSAEELEALLCYYEKGETVELLYEAASGGAYEEKSAEITLQERAKQETNGEETQLYDPFSMWDSNPWFDGWWGF